MGRDTVPQYFEDFEIDASAESEGRTITDADVAAFAALSGDYNPIHTDEEYARRSPFRRRIAHGALIFSISTGLAMRISPPDEALVAFLGIDSLRFARPVFLGDTIRLRTRVVEKRERDPKRGLVTFENTVLNQRDQAVLVYSPKVIFLRRLVGKGT
jgi:3-hydroxybutyryl-CoA dehydratase